MTTIEIVGGKTKERTHDNCASNCEQPWQAQDPVAHCPRCCTRSDHVLVHDDHEFHGVVVGRWAHRTDPSLPAPDAGRFFGALAPTRTLVYDGLPREPLASPAGTGREVIDELEALDDEPAEAVRERVRAICRTEHDKWGNVPVAAVVLALRAGPLGSKPLFTLCLDGLGIREHNALSRAGYTTIEHVELLSDDDLLNCRGVGPQGVKNIRDALASYHEA